MSELLNSFERDFDQVLTLLNKIVSSEETYESDRTKFALSDAQNLLKQMEVEAMNFAQNDQVRKQISGNKKAFEQVRKDVRKLQQQKDKESLHSVESFEMEDLESHKQDKQMLQNRRNLEEAKAVGYACEDMAGDIKFNLRKQTDQLKNSTMANLREMDSDLGQSNAFIRLIQNERRKNRLVIWGIMALFFVVLIFIIVMSMKKD